MADSDREAERRNLIGLLMSIGSVDRFSDLQCLGDGGASGNFSALLTAQDGSTGRRVALKFLLPSQLGTYREGAFRREVALMAELSGHPDIVQLVAPCSEFSTVLQTPEGFQWRIQAPYYALELARTDFGAVVAHAQWPVERLLVGFRAMCRGVQALHRRRVAHRDLKPSNFLVVDRDTMRLSDFGGARLLDGKSTALASYAGPPGDLRYSAPELHALVHEEVPDIAFASDFFSLGAILFEMFSGTMLGPRIFDDQLLSDLRQVMMRVKPGLRQQVFDGFVSELADGTPIPSVTTFGAAVPGCLRDPIDRLVTSLAALDYRRRVVDFASVFNRVDSCLLILKHEMKIQELKRLRRVRLSTRFSSIGAGK